MICPYCKKYCGYNSHFSGYVCKDCGYMQKEQFEPTTAETLNQIVDSFGEVIITKEYDKYSFYVRDTTAPLYGDTLAEAIRAAYTEAKKREVKE